MVKFSGALTHPGTGVVYSFDGEAEFQMDRVAWKAQFFRDGVSFDNHSDVVLEVGIGSLTERAAVQGARNYLVSTIG